MSWFHSNNYSNSSETQSTNDKAKSLKKINTTTTDYHYNLLRMPVQQLSCILSIPLQAKIKCSCEHVIKLNEFRKQNTVIPFSLSYLALVFCLVSYFRVILIWIRVRVRVRGRGRSGLVLVVFS